MRLPKHFVRWLLASVAVVLMAGFVIWKGFHAPTKPRSILVILPSPTNPYWVSVRAGAESVRDELKSKGYEMEVQSSQDMNAGDQVDLLRQYLGHADKEDMNLAAVVIGPASDVDIVPTLGEYSSKGIPIVVIDTELNPQAAQANKVDVDAFIGSDNRQGGRMAADEIADAPSHPKTALLIEGSRVHQSAIDRADGFQEEAKKRGVHVFAVPGEWKRDRAQQLVSAQFVREPLDAIFASNDDMALGAVTALRDLRIRDQQWPIIVGFDATRDGLEAVTDGTMYATIQQDSKRLGREGIRTAVKVIERDPSLLRRQINPLIMRTR